MTVTADDLDSVISCVMSGLLPITDRDWSVRAGTLEWDCWHTAEHFRDDGSVATERLSSAGRPTPLTTVAIMDDEGHLLGPGERGEIVARGPLVMAGYYKNPQASAEAAKHGWHHTGDIGYLDEDGYLFLCDRKADMIISGGANIYPAEIEGEIIMHPQVADVAVFGIPDDDWGESVAAVVQPEAEEELDAALRRADAALYLAKGAGRNCVVADSG